MVLLKSGKVEDEKGIWFLSYVSDLVAKIKGMYSFFSFMCPMHILVHAYTYLHPNVHGFIDALFVQKCQQGKQSSLQGLDQKDS